MTRAGSFTVGRANIETQLSISGPSTALSKTFRARHRLLNYQRIDQGSLNTGPFNPASIKATPVFGCSQGSGSATCKYATPTPVTIPTNGEWSNFSSVDVQFDWVKDADQLLDIQEFSLFSFLYNYAIEGSDMERPNGNGMFGFSSGMGFLYPLRCDRGVAHLNTKGCVFPAAAAVYVLSRKDDTVKEAAEHILEAQTGPLQSPGKFLRRPGTRAMADQSVMGGAALQRAKLEKVKDGNNYAACKRSVSTSLISQRPANSSATCSPEQAGCDCDEYPFAATWSGAKVQPEKTSVKWINFSQNRRAGSQLGIFYRQQRVLDFTQVADGPFSPLDPDFPSPQGGDDFWVYVK